ncbi:MAG: ribose-5-phosphate isomerase RpiA [Candidatus Thermoplasmatota archaeon]|nr:ribose-5-phosphate isomerase RpiA [Candidatus Thermoplasmatota archaeon]
MDHKEMAAREAVKYIEDGMIVGLGSGSTASIAIKLIGEKVKGEGIDIIGIPTSRASDLLGRAVGIKIGELDDHPHVDITIDGADEVGPRLNLVKGLGGALLREKIVAAATQLELIVVDESKLVQFIGQKSPLPVEIAKFSHKTTMLRLASLGCSPVLRMIGDAPYVTDNGNYIADCRFQKIADPAAMEIKIDHIPGVVESGLFIGLTSRVIVGSPSGIRILEKQCML